MINKLLKLLSIARSRELNEFEKYKVDFARMFPNQIEKNSDIVLFFIDETYGKAVDDEHSSSQLFEKKLRAQISQELFEVDVLPGASLPAWAYTFASDLPIVIDFLSGVLIVNDSVKFLLNVADKVKKKIGKREVVLSRNAATLIALDAVFNEMDGTPKSIKILSYYHKDTRYEDDEIDVEIDTNKINEAPFVEYLAVTEHYCKIEADGVEFLVRVKGSAVEIIEQE